MLKSPVWLDLEKIGGDSGNGTKVYCSPDRRFTTEPVRRCRENTGRWAESCRVGDGGGGGGGGGDSGCVAVAPVSTAVCNFKPPRGV